MTGTRRENLGLRILQAGSLAVVVAASTYKSYELDRFFVPKELVLHITAFLALLFLVRSFRRAPMTRVDTLLLGFLAVSAASAIFATNHWLAIRALTISASAVALFWSGRALREAGLERPLIAALALAVLLGAASALLQTYGLRLDLFSLNRAPGGTLGNRNFVAHMMAFGLPLLLLAAFRAPTLTRYLMSAIGAAAVVGVLVLTRSRAAWLAFAAAIIMLLFGMLASRAIRSSGRMWARLFGMIVIAGVSVASVIFLPNSLRWRSDNPYLQSFKGVANYQEGSGRGRLIQYKQSVKMTLRNPVLGVGPGNWAVEYPKHAARRDPSLNNSQPGTTANPWPSSDWVAFLSERGFFAAMMLLAAFLAIGIRSLQRIVVEPDTFEAFGATTVLSILAAATVAGAFDAVLLLALPTLIIWPALGALWVPRRREATTLEEAESLTEPKPRRIAPAFVLLFVVFIGVLRSGSQLYSMNAYENADGRNELERASLIDPGNYKLQLRLARSGKRASRCAHALVARDLYPRAEAARSAASGCKK